MTDHIVSSYGIDEGIADGMLIDISKPARMFLHLDHKPATFKFDPGRVLMTPGIERLLAVGTMTHLPGAIDLLARHLAGDWGSVDAEDGRANDQALAAKEGRLLSSYTYEGEAVWIITEPGVTTIMLPEEY